jgi:mono/diheme cytochrome c family protein
MKQALQIKPLVGTLLAALLLTACGQPAEESAGAAAPAAEAAGASNDEVTSIDAAGNVAPFGMASRQPVEVPPIDAAAAATTAAADPGLYAVQCAACHGADAQGVAGLGLNLVDSELVNNSSPEDLRAFLKAGRSPDSPDSVSGIPMPAFAWMEDSQLDDIVVYIQSL